MDKPKPIVEKISLTQDQLDDINAIMEMRPTKAQIAKWEKSGRMRDWKHHYRPSSRVNRIKKIQRIYFKGLCHTCNAFPSYKLTWKLDGANLVEYYCESHLNKIT